MNSFEELETFLLTFSNNILNNNFYSIKTNVLMDIYTFIYKECINDKSNDKVNIDRLTYLHNNLISNFMNQIKIMMMEAKKISEIFMLYNKYIYFAKNINIMFRYINKSRLIQSISNKTLETKCISLFNQLLFPAMDMKCSSLVYEQCSESYQLNNHFIEEFLKLIRIYYKNKLPLGNILNYLREGIDFYFRQNLPIFKNIDELIYYVHIETNKLQELEKKISLNVNLEKIIIDIIKGTDNFKVLVQNSFHDVKNNLNILTFLFSIDYKLLIDCFIVSNQEMIQKNPCIKTFIEIHYLHNELSKIVSIEPLNDDFKKTLQKFINCISFYKNFSLHLLQQNQDSGFLLDWIMNKDEFIKIYGKLLLDRLLHHNNLDIDLELKIIQFMKQYIINNLIFYLESLIYDYRNSILFSRNFSGRLRSNIYIFSNKFLIQDNIWNNSKFDLSDSMFKLKSTFHDIQKYYKSQYENRTLHLIPYLSYVIIEATYNDNSVYYLNMLIPQYLILEQIVNGKNTISQLQQIFNCDQNLLGALLHSMSNGKYAFLKKSGDRTMVDITNDIFTINSGFKSDDKYITFKLPNIDNKKSKQIIRTDHEILFILRAHIMRMLKKNKSMEFNSILQQCSIISQNPSTINEQLDFLIDKDYIVLENHHYVYIP